MSFGEIKKAVNSNLGKPLDTLIEEKTGAVNATGGTATAGGIFAKLNKLLTDWTTARAGKIDTIDTNVGSLVNGRVVKSVQRGIGTSTADSTLTVPISTINPSKSMAILDGFMASNINSIALLQSLSSNSITIITSGTGYAGSKIGWQVIEFY